MHNDNHHLHHPRNANQEISFYSENDTNSEISTGLISKAEIRDPQLLNKILKTIGINPLEKDSPENQKKISTLEKLMVGHGMFNNNILTKDELNRVFNWIDNPLEAPASLSEFADELNGYARDTDLEMSDVSTPMDDEADVTPAGNAHFESGMAQDVPMMRSRSESAAMPSNTGNQSSGSSDASPTTNPYFKSGASSGGGGASTSSSPGNQATQASPISSDMPMMRSRSESPVTPPTTDNQATDASPTTNPYFKSGASSGGGGASTSSSPGNQATQATPISSDIPIMSSTSETVSEPPHTVPMDHANRSTGAGYDGVSATHDGHGSSIDFAAHDQAFKTMNANGASIPSLDQGVAALEAQGAYNNGQPENRKVIGAYLALNTLAKLQTMPPNQLGGEANASKVYGALKVAGLSGDGDKIRSTLAANGGDDFGLSNDQLVELWGANEHEYLHPILFGDETVSNTVHMTSLNFNDGRNPSEGPAGTIGGYNNKGEYPQWGWFEAAQEYGSVFS